MFAAMKPIIKKVLLIFAVLILLLLAVNWLFPELGTTLQAKRLLRFWQEYEPSEKVWIAVALDNQPLMNLSKEKYPEIWKALSEVTYDKEGKPSALTSEDRGIRIHIYDQEKDCGTWIYLTNTERQCYMSGSSEVREIYLKNTFKLYRAAGDAYAKQFGEDYNEKYYAADWTPGISVTVAAREGQRENIRDEAGQKALIAILQGLRYEMTLDDFLTDVSDVEHNGFDYKLWIWYPGEKKTVLVYGINAGEGSVYLSRAVDNSTGINGKLRLEHGADLYPFLQSILPREAND